MSTNKSEGPPPHSRSKQTLLTDFVNDMIEAEGGWVQMRILGEHKSNSYTRVLFLIGQKYADVSQANGVLYGRMKEPK